MHVSGRPAEPPSQHGRTAYVLHQQCHTLLQMLRLSPTVASRCLQGVGSHAAAMLLRSGVSQLRLIDFDQVRQFRTRKRRP